MNKVLRWESGAAVRFAAALLLVLTCLGISGCGGVQAALGEAPAAEASARSAGVAAPSLPFSEESAGRITADSIPAYEGEPSVEVNGGVPAFTEEDLDRPTFEDYAPLDALGRCGTAFALVSDDTRPANGEKRGNISAIKPTGWVQGRYEDLPDSSLYNRSHLIAWSLGAENDNPRNLITGTASMNQGAMQSVENRILAYIRNTGNHVLVRVTPVFAGNELLARGVQYEAFSIEDGGRTICVNEFMFNVQPGIQLDYATGVNQRAAAEEPAATGSVEGAEPMAAGDLVTDAQADAAVTVPGAAAGAGCIAGGHHGQGHHGCAVAADGASAAVGEHHCILNTNTGKVHQPGCTAVSRMKDSNKQDFTGLVDDLLLEGCTLCQLCW